MVIVLRDSEKKEYIDRCYYFVNAVRMTHLWNFCMRKDMEFVYLLMYSIQSHMSQGYFS
jgi:hypothetical protein